METIKNELLTIEVSALEAELQSINRQRLERVCDDNRISN